MYFRLEIYPSDVSVSFTPDGSDRDWIVLYVEICTVIALGKRREGGTNEGTKERTKEGTNK